MSKNVSLMPILHKNANPFALAHRVGLNPQCEHFALLIPTSWYPENPANPTQTTANPTRALTRTGGMYLN